MSNEQSFLSQSAAGLVSPRSAKLEFLLDKVGNNHQMAYEMERLQELRLQVAAQEQKLKTLRHRVNQHDDLHHPGMICNSETYLL